MNQTEMPQLQGESPLDDPFAWGISVIASVFGAGNVILGISLLADPERLRGVSFIYVLQFASAQIWGVAFIIAGLVSLYGQYRHRMWPTRLAHSASSVMAGIWACAFAYGSLVNSATPFTGIVAYGVFIAITHAVIAAVSPHRTHR